MKKFQSLKFQSSKCRIILISLLISSLEFIHAQAPATSSSFSFSLQQAVDYAIQNNSRIQNSTLDEQIAANKVKEIRGIGLPQLNSSYDQSHFFDIPASVIPASAFGGPAGQYATVRFAAPDNSNLALEASWLAVDAGYFLGLKATKIYMELAKRSSDRTRVDIIVAVKKAYYSVLINEQRLKLLSTNLDRLKKLLDDTKALNENGFVEKIDLDRTQVAYNNLSAEKEKIERLMQLGVLLLKYQMGMDQSATLTLTDNLESAEFKADNISTEKFDYTRRVEYKMLDLQKKGAELQIRKDQFSYLPNLVFFGSYKSSGIGYSDYGPKYFPASLIGGKVSMPIFTGGQRHYRLQQSKLSLLKSENDLKFLQQSIDLELNNAKTVLINASQTLEVQKKNIALAEDVNRVAKLKYEQGVGSNIEVLTAETAFKEAQVNYFSALYDALVAKIDYDKATGALSTK